MHQNDISFFYRGVALLIVGGVALTFLSSLNQRWAHYAGIFGWTIMFVAGAAFIAFVTFRQFRQFLNAPLPNEPLPPSVYLDHWYGIARLAVVASVLLSVVLAAVLLFIEPPKECPGWHLVDKRSTSLWLPFFMFTVPLLAALGFMVARWKWFVLKAIMTTDYPSSTPVAYTLVMTVIIGCAMSQLPWGLLVTRCWLRM